MDTTDIKDPEILTTGDRARSPQRGASLDALVNAIADQVAARVRQQLAREYQGNPPVLPRLLSVKDAAAYLGRTEQAIQHLIFDKELPVVRAGRRVHLCRRDLCNWVEKNKY